MNNEWIPSFFKRVTCLSALWLTLILNVHLNDVFLLLPAIALDDHIANFHMQEMKEEIPDISQHHRVKMEGNAYGILIYDKSLATFLGAFVETNHDNLDSMLAHVIAEHKVLSLIFQLNYSFSFSFRNYIFYYIWSNTLCKAGSNMKLYWFFLSAVVMNTEFYWPQVYFEPSKPSKMDSMCAYTYVCVYVCAAV